MQTSYGCIFFQNKTSVAAIEYRESDRKILLMKREAGGQGEFSVVRIFGAATPPEILPVRISRKESSSYRPYVLERLM